MSDSVFHVSSQISTLRRQGRTLFSTVPETAEKEADLLFVQEVTLAHALILKYRNTHMLWRPKGPLDTGAWPQRQPKIQSEVCYGV